MNNYDLHRSCLECGTTLKGRRDQKFCADHCRNQYNNRLYAQKLTIQRQVNRILMCNQQIIAQLVTVEKKRKVAELELHKRGYNFSFHTHLKLAKNGQTYIFCYDFGYLRINEHQLYLVQHNNTTFQ